MNNIHQGLVERHEWYAKWHSSPNHKHVHWATLVVVVTAVSLMVLQGINGFDNALAAYKRPTSAQLQAEALANDTRILSEGEYAVVTRAMGPLSGTIVTKVISLEDGTIISRELDKNIFFSVIEYKSGITTNVPANNPNVSIGSVYDFAGYDASGKIDK